MKPHNRKKFTFERELKVVSVYDCVGSRTRVRLQTGDDFNYCDVTMEAGALTEDDIGMKVTLNIKEREGG